MKKQIYYLLLIISFLLFNNIFAQEASNAPKEKKVSKLFRSQELLPLKLSYSNKELLKETNDSTYITTNLLYQTEKKYGIP